MSSQDSIQIMLCSNVRSGSYNRGGCIKHQWEVNEPNIFPSNWAILYTLDLSGKINLSIQRTAPNTTAIVGDFRWFTFLSDVQNTDRFQPVDRQILSAGIPIRTMRKFSSNMVKFKEWWWWVIVKGPVGGSMTGSYCSSSSSSSSSMCTGRG